MPDTKNIKNLDVAFLFEAIKKINMGQSVDNAVEYFDKIKRPFIFLIVQEYFRKYENTLDIIKNLSHKKSDRDAILIIQISIIMIYYSKKPIHSIVNDSVEFSKYFKTSSYVNAILRSILKEKTKYAKLLERQKLNKKFLKQLVKIYSSKTLYNYIIKSINQKPINYQISYSDDKKLMYDNRVSVMENFKNINNKSWVQDIGNYECIKSIKELIANKKVLDACSAPGGKSFLMKSFQADVECIDINKDQIKKFIENVERLKLDLKIKESNFLSFKFKIIYDAILIDAPCSSLGTFRRNPDVMIKAEDIRYLIDKQKKQILMLNQATHGISQNGHIIYMVCSFHPFETIEVIDKFLKKNTDFGTINLKSDKLLKKNNGYFINPFSFKEYGGADSFFISVLQRKN